MKGIHTMRKFSTFAAASVVAAGLLTTGAAAASAAAGPCSGVANAVAGVQAKDVRGTFWVCRGAGGQYRKTGSSSVTACWAANGYKVQLYNGDKKVACPAKNKEVKNWTGFKVVRA
ncbi:hypothetical protein [Allokutzneria oryzae]|uniref:Secreted protein n=1 Tax=Allokutzneria oryzae TaxID=1378989 RepID=A0ABV6A171_9PSEU